LVLYPNVQVKAHEELDRVLDQGKVPEFRDRKDLRFLECVVWEVYGWHNAILTGVARRSMEDDIYDGMFIPKGSAIIPNIRGITLDEDVYDIPHFSIPAGTGRYLRICPGRHPADANIWIAIAFIL
ncbi:cytochrome P450, partial [Agrocybe pediades]